MWLFLKRYFGRYLWTAIYASFVGALVGMACFSVPFFFVVIALLPQILSVGLLFAAPLNIVVLPIAFHVLRDHPRRLTLLRLAGVVGGFFSPMIGALALGLINPAGPWGIGTDSEAYWRLWQQYAPAFAGFSVVGALAGFVCAKLFHKHGDKPSVFDVNAALQSHRS